MDRHAAAYGKMHLLPKHHAMMHIPTQIWKHKFVVDMFVVERFNIRVKQSAENSVRNTERHEHDVLSNLLARHHNDLTDGVQSLREGLRGSRKELPGYPNVELGHGAWEDGRELH
eukprot:3179278-Pyramimonas_sp.AAC.1